MKDQRSILPLKRRCDIYIIIRLENKPKYNFDKNQETSKSERVLCAKLAHILLKNNA